MWSKENMLDNPTYLYINVLHGLPEYFPHKVSWNLGFWIFPQTDKLTDIPVEALGRSLKIIIYWIGLDKVDKLSLLTFSKLRVVGRCISKLAQVHNNLCQAQNLQQAKSTI